MVWTALLGMGFDCYSGYTVVRALIILALLWVIALVGFLGLRQIPKTSLLWGLRDFFWMLILALSVVSLLAIVALITGIITIQDNPFVSLGN